MAHVGRRWRWLRVALQEAKDFRDNFPDEARELLWSLDAQKGYLEETGESPEWRERGQLRALGAFRGGDVAIWLYFVKRSQTWLALHLAVVVPPSSKGGKRARRPDPPLSGWDLAQTRATESLASDTTKEEPGTN